MKFLLIGFCVFLPTTLYASTCRDMNFGNTMITHCDDGSELKTERFGNQIITTDNSGNRWTTERIGNQTITRDNQNHTPTYV